MARKSRAGHKQDVAAGFVDALLEESPWLDGKSEVNDELAEELLGELFDQWELRPRIPAFVGAYNEFVLVNTGARHPTREQAYAQMLRVLDSHGRNSPTGDGDFWLVEDSFSTDSPCVVVFSSTSGLSTSALQQLGEAAAICQFFSQVLVVDEDGNVLQTRAVLSGDG